MTGLSDRELERYARNIVLPELGGVGQRLLKRSGVAVIGAGGIGSAVIQALAAAGVGRLTIIDDGDVERSNLQRQTIFRDDQIDCGKAQLAAAFAGALNPDIAVHGIWQRLGEGISPGRGFLALALSIIRFIDGELEAAKELGDWGSLTASVFHNRITDYVTIVPLPGGRESVGNIDSATETGVSLNGTIRLEPIGFRGAKIDLEGRIRSTRSSASRSFFVRRSAAE